MTDDKTDTGIPIIQDESLFKVVVDLGNFRMLLNSHVINHGHVLLRNTNGDQFFSKTFTLNENNTLECSAPVSKSGDFLPSFINKNIFVDFFSGRERFHFETISSAIKNSPNPGTLVFPIPKYIFQRQRRTQFRYILPENFVGAFSLKDSANNVCFGKVIDISNMGLSIIWQANIPKLKTDDLITGLLTLGQGKSFPIKAIICFIQLLENSMRMGIEFTEIDAKTLDILALQIVGLQKFVFDIK